MNVPSSVPNASFPEVPAVGESGAATGGATGAATRSFGEALAAAIDGTSQALERADVLAGAVATGAGDVAQASVARAKADVMLEVVSVASARASGALNALLQTQV